EALRAAAARRRLSNARVVASCAQRVLAHCVPDESVNAHHAYFPDPWPKTGHRHRRLLGGGFARHLLRTLVPGGAVHLASDLPALIADIATQCVAAGLVIESGAEPLPRPTTAFERGNAAAGTSTTRLVPPGNEAPGFGPPIWTGHSGRTLADPQ